MTDDGLHECPAPGCEERVPSHVLACPTHWFQVPKPLRDELWRAWKHGSVADHLEAREQCVLALRDAT